MKTENWFQQSRTGHWSKFAVGNATSVPSRGGGPRVSSSGSASRCSNKIKKRCSKGPRHRGSESIKRVYIFVLMLRPPPPSFPVLDSSNSSWMTSVPMERGGHRVFQNLNLHVDLCPNKWPLISQTDTCFGQLKLCAMVIQVACWDYFCKLWITKKQKKTRGSLWSYWHGTPQWISSGHVVYDCPRWTCQLVVSFSFQFSYPQERNNCGSTTYKKRVMKLPEVLTLIMTCVRQTNNCSRPLEGQPTLG